MKPTLFIASLFMSAAIWAANLTGTIQTDTQAPIAGAVVSDGYSVVSTNSNGAYTMPYNAAATYVFVSVPSGYDIPTDADGSPQIWQKIDKTATSHQHDFTLHRQEDGGKADSTHVLVVMGDPQVIDEYGLWRFRNETMADIQQLQASYPAGTKFVGLVVGDLVWDAYKYFPNQKANLETLDFPTFIAIGNHDHNRSGAAQPTIQEQDSIASLKFEQYFGPTYYSFNRGAIHYIVMDNVYYWGNKDTTKGYDCQLTDKQIAWVKQDIATLHEGTQVVFAMHINSGSMAAQRDSLRKWIKPLNTTNYLMSGHVHTSETFVWSASASKYSQLIEHNIAATQGSYWCSDWCADGAPNGYKVFETNQQGICNWYYKGTGLDREMRMQTYPMGSINAGNSKQAYVLANVWDYDKKGCTVTVRVNGQEKEMEQFTGKDPNAYDIMLDDGDTRPNYPTEAGRNPGAKETTHLFCYMPTPAEQDADFEVVFTDRFGHVTTAPILRHMMVASFHQEAEKWIYTQDFNTLPRYAYTSAYGTWIAGHTPLGWYAAHDTVGYDYLRVDKGALTSGGIYSYDRALGSITTNTQANISLGLIIENNTGATITAIDVNYTGELWHAGTAKDAHETLAFSYAILTNDEAQGIRDRTAWIGQISTTPVSELNFTAPKTSVTESEVDGNDPANRQEISGTILLNLPPGGVALLRWNDTRSMESKDQGLAIDDVRLIAHTAGTGLQEKATQVIPWGAHTYMRGGHIFIQSDTKTYTITGQTY